MLLADIYRNGCRNNAYMDQSMYLLAWMHTPCYTKILQRYILGFSGFWCDGSSTRASGLALRNLAEFLCFQNLIDFHLIGEE